MYYLSWSCHQFATMYHISHVVLRAPQGSAPQISRYTQCSSNMGRISSRSILIKLPRQFACLFTHMWLISLYPLALSSCKLWLKINKMYRKAPLYFGQPPDRRSADSSLLFQNAMFIFGLFHAKPHYEAFEIVLGD